MASGSQRALKHFALANAVQCRSRVIHVAVAQGKPSFAFPLFPR